MNAFEKPAKQEPTPEELMTPKQRQMSEDREEWLENSKTGLVQEYFSGSAKPPEEVRQRWPDATDARRITGVIKNEAGKLEKVQLFAARRFGSPNHNWEYFMGTVDGQPISAERAKELVQQYATKADVKEIADQETRDANRERDKEFPKNVTNEGGL